MGSVVLQNPTWGTHPKINWHLDYALPLRWTGLPLLSAPWQQGTCATCLHIIVLGVHGN